MTTANDNKPTPSDDEPRLRVDRPNRQHEFDHHRLDAYEVALEAMVEGDAIAEAMPRGYGKLEDQLKRALQGAFTQTAEAAARTGADRVARFRAARAEAGEAAAILEGIERLEVGDAVRIDHVLGPLWRLCAMLTRLAQLRR